MTDDLAAQNAARFGAIAATYSASTSVFDVAGAQLVVSAALRRDDHVLDLCCGRGACLIPAAVAVGDGGRALGLDLAPEMIELTRADLIAAGLHHAEVRVADVVSLDLRDSSFDAVLCGFGIFFLVDPAATFAEVARVLRPRGRFLATTFTDDHKIYPAWLDDLFAAYDLVRPPVPLTTGEGLDEMLRAVGFGPVERAEGAITVRYPTADDVVEQLLLGSAMGPRIRTLEDGVRAELERTVRERVGDGPCEFDVGVRWWRAQLN